MGLLWTMELSVLYFAAYSVLGWACETVYCSVPQGRLVKRGFLTGPYCPIYGFGGVAIQFLLYPFAGDPAVLFVAGVVLTSAIEYFTSWAMEKLFHAKWWDYSDHKVNINGRVCLTNSLLFGVMALLLSYLIQPWLGERFLRLSPSSLLALSVTITVVFIVDAVHSTVATIGMHSMLAQYLDIKDKATEALDAAAVLAGRRFHERLEHFRAHRDEFSADTRARLEAFMEQLEKFDRHSFTQRRILAAFPTLRERVDKLKGK